MPISAALRQGAHIRVATVASRGQRVGDLIGSGFEPILPETDVFPFVPCYDINFIKLNTNL